MKNTTVSHVEPVKTDRAKRKAIPKRANFTIGSTNVNNFGGYDAVFPIFSVDASEFSDCVCSAIKNPSHPPIDGDVGMYTLLATVQ